MSGIKYFLTDNYQEMKVMGVLGVFSNEKIERDSLPEGFFKYSLQQGGIRGSRYYNRHRFLGDFICKKKLDLGEDGSKDLDESVDYVFTGLKADVNKFFGVDFLLKLAEELDDFYSIFDPKSYSATLKMFSSKENMVDDIKEMLLDRDQCEGIYEELCEVCDTNKIADNIILSERAKALRIRVNEILVSFPVKRIKLDKQISTAEESKLSAANPQNHGE